MVDSPAFEWVCAALESETSLGRLEARGTMRLALKKAGLEPGRITKSEMAVILDRVLPRELVARGIADGAAFCARLGRRILSASLDGASDPDAPEAVFERLGG